MDQQRAFKGIWIPKEIWLSKELTLQEKVFLVEIDSLDNEQGCFASNNYFSEFFGLTTGRVSQIINNLKEKGYLSVSFEKQGKQIIKRILKINRPPYPYLENYIGIKNTKEGIKFSKGGIKNIKGGYLENCEDNNINNNNTINNINNNIIMDTKVSTTKKFIPPTVEEVKEYCIERNNNVDAERFIDYYTANGWKVGKNSMKDWKAAVRTWERRSDNGGYNTNSKKDTEYDPKELKYSGLIL